MQWPLSRSPMAVREQPLGFPGPVYLVPGRGLGKCKDPEVGAWRVLGIARRPLRRDRVGEEVREARLSALWGTPAFL